MQTDDGLHIRHRGFNGAILALMNWQKAVELRSLDEDSYRALHVRDVAKAERSGPVRVSGAESERDSIAFAGESRECDVRVRLDVRRDYACIRHTLVVEDLAGEDRALTVRYPIPVAAEGWLWWDDAANSRVIEAGRRYVRYDNESPGRFPECWYPLGTISGPGGDPAAADHALTLAVPLNPPTLARVGYDGDLFIEFDLGLSPACLKSPGRAEVEFLLYTSEPAWGFRGALRKYYDLYPADFVKRVNREGLWLARTPIQRIRHPEDFGIVFHQVSSVKTNPLHYDNAAGLYTFLYDEPSRVSLTLKATEKPKPEDFVKLLDEAVADPKSPIHEQANRVRRVASRKADGGYYVHVFGREEVQWAAYFEANLDPEIGVEKDAGPSRLDEWWANSAEPGVRGAREGRYDGVYIDSAEAWVNSINFNRKHFAYADRPLIWDAQSGRPGILTAIATYKYLREVGARLHAIGRLHMANFTPWNHGFFATAFDVLGTEVWGGSGEWLRLFRERIAEPGGKERLIAAGLDKGTLERVAAEDSPNPRDIVGHEVQDTDRYIWDTERLMHYRRAMAGQKPYNLLLKLMSRVAFEVFGMERLQRYIDWCLFWGMYPSVSEAMIDAQEEMAPLYRRAMPVIRALGAAGWEPVTHARSSHPDVRIERFGYAPLGTLHFTVRNFGEKARRATITIDAEALRIPEEAEVRDAFTGRKPRQRGKEMAISLGVALDPAKSTVLCVALW